MTKPKLLLADDSVTIRKVVELTFADEGIEVSTVADAESAMQRFVEIQPDIVLLDVNLIGTSGYQMCEMIKADAATARIPVLLLVGSFEPFDQVEAERVQADGFLTKPFHSIRDLVTQVWRLLGRDTEPMSKPESVLPPVPTFSDDLSEADTLPTATEPDDDDIENLYRSSFAEAVEIEDIDTARDLLGDTGMDDEMIQASFMTASAGGEDFSPTGEKIEQLKEFDWSSDSIIAETKPLQAEDDDSGPQFFAEATREPETVEAIENEVVENEKADDMLGISQDSPADEDQGSTTEADHFVSPETVEVSDVQGFVESEAAAGDLESDDEEIELFEEDVKAVTAVADIPLDHDSESVVSMDVDPAIHDTFPYHPGEQPPVSENDLPQSLSPEMIEKIVRLVVERLSDSVIRDIAQVEVPRVAEKLIREALEEEK